MVSPVSQGLGRCQGPWRVKSGERPAAFLREPFSGDGCFGVPRRGLAVPRLPSEKQQPLPPSAQGSTRWVTSKHLRMLAHRLPLSQVTMAEFSQKQRKQRGGGEGLASVVDFLLANARLVLGVSGAAVLGIATLAVKRVRPGGQGLRETIGGGQDWGAGGWWDFLRME